MAIVRQHAMTQSHILKVSALQPIEKPFGIAKQLHAKLITGRRGCGVVGASNPADSFSDTLTSTIFANRGVLTPEAGSSRSAAIGPLFVCTPRTRSPAIEISVTLHGYRRRR
jgi:hypothetical protein